LKRPAEYTEGPEAFQRFDALVSEIMAVPRSVILEREAEHKRRSALNPKRRGPKPKSSSSPAPASLPQA
jgi:hypothetical protein